MNYYLVKSYPSGEVMGVLKSVELWLLAMYTSFSRINQAQFETYKEFGMKELLHTDMEMEGSVFWPSDPRNSL